MTSCRWIRIFWIKNYTILIEGKVFEVWLIFSILFRLIWVNIMTYKRMLNNSTFWSHYFFFSLLTLNNLIYYLLVCGSVDLFPLLLKTFFRQFILLNVYNLVIQILVGLSKIWLFLLGIINNYATWTTIVRVK